MTAPLWTRVLFVAMVIAGLFLSVWGIAHGAPLCSPSDNVCMAEARHPDIPAGLLVSVCEWETRNHPDPDNAKHTPRKNPTPLRESWGRCQLTVPTIATLMDVPDELLILTGAWLVLKWFARDPLFGPELGARALERCLLVEGAIPGKTRIETNEISKALHCYNAGINAEWDGFTPYTRAVMRAWRY